MRHLATIATLLILSGLRTGGPAAAAEAAYTPSVLGRPWYETAIKDDQTALTISINGDPLMLYSESHALLIGEVNYKSWPRLEVVPQQIGELAKALERQRFKVHIYFDLTSENITDVIDQFIKQFGRPDSRLVVYVAAHGYARQSNPKIGYVLPIDSPPDSASEEDIAARALAMPMFQAWAQAPFARHELFIFDSCFAGAFFGYATNFADVDLPPTRVAPNAEGFTVDKANNIIPPPPEKSGSESSNFILDLRQRQRGRQFLAAGDSDELAPGRSILTPLLVTILDDINTRPQTNFDSWTTGDEIGEWIRDHGKGLQQALFADKEAPSPIYGRLPNDSLYQQGNIVFARNDMAGIPVVDDPMRVQDWQVAIANSIPTAPIITADLVQELVLSTQVAQADEQAAINAQVQLQTLSQFSSPSLGPFGNSQPNALRQAINRAQETAVEAQRRSTTSKAAVLAAQAAIRRVTLTVNEQLASVKQVVASVSPSDVARLTPADEEFLRKTAEVLSSDNTTIRRAARTDLANWLAQAPPAKQSLAVGWLVGNLSGKSYRFQLGVAKAIGDQEAPLTIESPKELLAEIRAAQSSRAAADPTLSNELKRAESQIQKALPLPK